MEQLRSDERAIPDQSWLMTRSCPTSTTRMNATFLCVPISFAAVGMNISGIPNPAMAASTESTSRALLKAAIESATPQRLRVTLQRMCDDNAECFRLASEQLLTRQTTESNGHGATKGHKSKEGCETQSAQMPTNNTKSRKRGLDTLRQRYQVCVQCDEEYDVYENEGEEDLCRWHEGMYMASTPMAPSLT